MIFNDYFQFAQISYYLSEFQSLGIVQNIKICLFILSLVLLFVSIIINLKISRLRRPAPTILTEIIPPQPAAGGPWQARWEEIQRHIESTKEAEWKFAVIEADKLVEDALDKAGFGGQTMSERLNNIAPGQFQNLDNLWEAHKIRNRLAHDVNYFLRYAEAKRAIKLFEETLKELQVL